MSVVTQFSGPTFTIGDGGNRDCEDGGGIKQNGAGISTGAVSLSELRIRTDQADFSMAAGH
jgi:hypothetical protein